MVFNCQTKQKKKDYCCGNVVEITSHNLFSNNKCQFTLTQIF